jgi:N4-(beta-N-acetylglucosaminyl)-L-asparaginase
MTFSRRDFVKTSVLGAVAAGVGAHTTEAHAEASGQASASSSTKRPIIISANNGRAYVESAYAFLKAGADTLDAAVRVVMGPENDPKDDSVGLGGLPNEEGVVELDACCMHGPTRRAGSVGGVRNIKNVSMVAKAVMEHTGHVMLVGEGAERFAVAMGFPRENLLTERSRKIWELWKETNSAQAWPTRTGSRRRSQSRRPISGVIAFSNCASAPPISALSPSSRPQQCAGSSFHPLARSTARR